MAENEKRVQGRSHAACYTPFTSHFWLCGSCVKLLNIGFGEMYSMGGVLYFCDDNQLDTHKFRL